MPVDVRGSSERVGAAGSWRGAVHRMAARLALVVSVVLVAAVVPAATAAAAPYTTQIVNSNVEDACLSANFNNDVYIATCSGAVYHQWEQISYGRLRNKGTGRCLSTNNSPSVYTATCSTSTVHHRWQTQPGADPNKVRLRNDGSGKCLSANYQNDVYTAGCSTIPAHYWYFS